jgi:hypothetical protein
VAQSTPGPLNYPSNSPGAAPSSAASGSVPPWPSDSSPKIFLWGPPASGKTTFLGSLFVAQHRVRDFGTWSVVAADQRSHQFQDDLSTTLERRNRFPKATVDVDAPVSWKFDGDLSNTSYGRRHGPDDVPKFLRGKGWNRRITTVDFTLHLQDLPGGSFDPKNSGPAQDEIVKHLLQADAIVYLHDPLRDADGNDATTVEFFQNMLDRLMFEGRNELIKGKLHHYVAACVTKFDHPRVYRDALEQDFAILDLQRPHAPIVTPENSRPFFNWVCDRYRNSGVDIVRSALADKFIANRVSYYASSAIGFYEANDGSVDLKQCNNTTTVRDENGDTVDGIAGPLHPINVLEPLVDLAIKINRARGVVGGP